MDEKTLKTRGFYYTAFGKFGLTNSECNEYIAPIVRHALNDAIAAAVGMTDQPDAANTQNCFTGVNDETNQGVVFTENEYLVAKDRSKMKGDLTQFGNDVLHMIHDADFYALMQHAIEVEGGGGEHPGSEILPSGESPKMIGFIIIEGPPGSGKTLEKTNGPIMASASSS